MNRVIKIVDLSVNEHLLLAKVLPLVAVVTKVLTGTVIKQVLVVGSRSIIVKVVVSTVILLVYLIYLFHDQISRAIEPSVADLKISSAPM